MLSLHCNSSEGNPGISDRYTWGSLDVIPDEEAIPPGIFGLASKRSESAHIGKWTKGRNVECIAHRYLSPRNRVVVKYGSISSVRRM
jgi:hypothetical protein